MVELLDSLLLSVAQKFCDKFQQFTGLTKFRLQKWTLITSTVFFWGGNVSYFDPAMFALLSINTFSMMSIVRRTEKEESEFLANGKLFAVPWSDASLRFVLAMTIGCMGFLMWLLPSSKGGQWMSYGMISLSIWLYICACVPRPPSKSKAREWYERGLTWLNDQLKPAPIPAPN